MKPTVSDLRPQLPWMAYVRWFYSYPFHWSMSRDSPPQSLTRADVWLAPESTELAVLFPLQMESKFLRFEPCVCLRSCSLCHTALSLGTHAPETLRKGCFKKREQTGCQHQPSEPRWSHSVSKLSWWPQWRCCLSLQPNRLEFGVQITQHRKAKLDTTTCKGIDWYNKG